MSSLTVAEVDGELLRLAELRNQSGHPIEFAQMVKRRIDLCLDTAAQTGTSELAGKVKRRHLDTSPGVRADGCNQHGMPYGASLTLRRQSLPR